MPVHTDEVYQKLNHPIQKNNTIWRNYVHPLLQLFARKFLFWMLFIYLILGLAGYHDHFSILRTQLEQITRSLGFAISRVDIEGQTRVNDDEVITALGVKDQPSLFFFDVKSAQENLESLDKINKARVSRSFPDGLKIVLEERSPFALWQNNDHVYVIDKDGRKLGNYRENIDTSLTLVVGNGADKNAYELISSMSKFPILKNRVQAYVRISDRRWNIYMKNGPKVMLPEHKLTAALQSLNQLQIEYEILELDLNYIDMRSDDKLVVMPNKAASALIENQKQQ